jgi:hypothetical protein
MTLSAQETHDLIRSIKLVDEFFHQNTNKTAVWFKTPNPLLGSVEPIDFFLCGRGHRVLKFIETSIEENKGWDEK